MFGRRLHLFTIAGIPIRLDPSWFVVAFLVTWSLAAGLFPLWLPHYAPATYWIMGVAGALGLFLSILLHEGCHALVARRQGIPMQGITLFIFGGVAEMGDEPPSARAEFLMAAAGPLASIAIGLAALGLTVLIPGWPAAMRVVLNYLGVVNLILAGFNLVPAFPLDGGRLFRAVLWHRGGDLRRATRIASRVGVGFSYLLLLLGALRLAAGDVFGGIWSFLIGLFLRQAAGSAYQQVVARRLLEGEPVRRFMTRDPVSVRPDTTVSELLDQYVFRYHHKLFPVQDNGRLLGTISTQAVKQVPRAEWGRRTVGALALPQSEANAIRPDTDALQALGLMRKTGQPRLLVVDEGRLVGILTLRDLLDFLALKVELDN
ncbi:MAG TPA: site-2 protease family protein [Gemmatimonadales bacterium]|nr:site-2 protease family protein [Gemmatimonadales bacterium]